MKNQKKIPQQTHSISNAQVLISGWLEQQIQSGIELPDKDKARPELFSELMTMLMGYMEDPDIEYALAVLLSRGVTPEVGSKFMSAFDSRLSDSGVDLVKARQKADSKWADAHLHCWAEYALRRSLEWIEIHLDYSAQWCNPRILIHVTNILIEHLADKDQTRTLARLHSAGCSGDLGGLIKVFEQAWSKQVHRIVQSRLTPVERSVSNMIQKAILQST